MSHTPYSVAPPRISTPWAKSAVLPLAVAALFLCIGCAGRQKQPNITSCGIEMTAVQSSMMTAIGYDAQQKTLRIRFIQDADYDYSGVPPEIYQGFLSAESKGKYYHRYIKGKYPNKRVR